MSIQPLPEFTQAIKQGICENENEDKDKYRRMLDFNSIISDLSESHLDNKSDEDSI